ncbi:rhamnose mutarotase [Viridothelium virens]|uniref:Rhamnose mutarotase n=1 Tax=Viridothelium virens TaxID=1048519 RepID=A0A6A6GUG3_VIRVR|nr:rhamnose mutarotase [Viridothelium virens]
MSSPPKRVAQYVYLKPEYLQDYKKCHAAVWPEVLKQIKDCNIEDYSIFYDDAKSLLFASFKYVGSDWDSDMKAMSANPKVREWWDMTDKMQESPFPGATGSASGPWWKPVDEVFHCA